MKSHFIFYWAANKSLCRHLPSIYDLNGSYHSCICPALPRGTSDEAFHGCTGLAIHKIQILARIYNGGHEAFCICKLHRTVGAKYKPWRWTPSSVTGRTSPSTDTGMKSSRIRGHVGVIGADKRFVGVSEPATLCSSFCDTETISGGGNDPGSPALLSVVVEIRLLLLQPRIYPKIMPPHLLRPQT